MADQGNGGGAHPETIVAEGMHVLEQLLNQYRAFSRLAPILGNLQSVFQHQHELEAARDAMMAEYEQARTKLSSANKTWESTKERIEREHAQLRRHHEEAMAAMSAERENLSREKMLALDKLDNVYAKREAEYMSRQKLMIEEAQRLTDKITELRTMFENMKAHVTQFG